MTINREGPPLTVETREAGRPQLVPNTPAATCHTLTAMSQDYAFFTTALFNLAGFDRDPLVEFHQLHPELPAPISIDSNNTEFFTGLKQGILQKRMVRWNNRLYATPHEHWPALSAFLNGIRWMDHRQGIYARVFSYESSVCDRWWNTQHPTSNETKRCPVFVFGVASNKWMLYLGTPPDPFSNPVAVVGPPLPELALELPAGAGPEHIAMQNLGRKL